MGMTRVLMVTMITYTDDGDNDNDNGDDDGDHDHDDAVAAIELIAVGDCVGGCIQESNTMIDYFGRTCARG